MPAESVKSPRVCGEPTSRGEIDSGIRYYHGGKAGLKPGDLLIPSPPHVNDGCPVCVARDRGRTVTVGEYRAWLRAKGPAAARVLAELEGADDAEPIDPPSGRHAVYITTDEDYALWYAARSRGDLYRVVPVGPLDPSPEDNFPSWTCRAALVAEVVKRKVRLRERERRRISHRWQLADSARATLGSPPHA